MPLKENLIMGTGLLIVVVAASQLVKADGGDNGGGGNNNGGGGGDTVEDRDAKVTEWKEWSNCSSKGMQERKRYVMIKAQGNGKTPSLVEERSCIPTKEDDPIGWEGWNSQRIIDAYNDGTLTYSEAYSALEWEHGWSNNDITEVLDAEQSSLVMSSQSYISDFF